MRSISKWAGAALLGLGLMTLLAPGTDPAGAQIVSTTTTTQPTTTTTRPTTTTTRPSTTTTNRPTTSTTGDDGSTTTTAGDGPTTTTGRSSTTSSNTTETTEPTEPREATSTIPTPSTTPSDSTVPKPNPGSAEISPLFPWLSVIGLGTAAALAGTRWYQTRPEAELEDGDVAEG
jgi:hypothetical protein